MDGSSSLGVRKGAWSPEEDHLLRNCIQTYGEGKWHLVPSRSGLNRCRKSCRLRWLNHLSPDIKRGVFESDEADLIIKLHRLLGNRWSLIAGRIPGRTANGVKNFWNSHLRKEVESTRELENKSNTQNVETTNVIRPHPHNLVKNPYRVSQQINAHHCVGNHNIQSENVCLLSSLPLPRQGNASVVWCQSLLVEEDDEHVTCSVNEEREVFFTGLLSAQEFEADTNLEGVNDFDFDMDIWNLIDSKVGYNERE